MSQNLKGVGYADNAYTIIFITVASHNGQVFSFTNQLNNRLEFFWDRWGKWKNTLTPYSSHAFLVKAYNTNSDSGMGFTPEEHLCEFINLHEARVFNTAYLTKYNKLANTNKVDEVNELAGEFGNKLMDMAEMRHDWMETCERAANAIFSGEIFREFFGENPEPGEAICPWDRDLFKCDHYVGWGDGAELICEQPLVLKCDPDYCEF